MVFLSSSGMVRAFYNHAPLARWRCFCSCQLHTRHATLTRRSVHIFFIGYRLLAEVFRAHRHCCHIFLLFLVPREYPLDWITRQMKKSGMVVTAAKKMPVLYAPHTVKRQVLCTMKNDAKLDLGVEHKAESWGPDCRTFSRSSHNLLREAPPTLGCFSLCPSKAAASETFLHPLCSLPRPAKRHPMAGIRTRWSSFFLPGGGVNCMVNDPLFCRR